MKKLCFIFFSLILVIPSVNGWGNKSDSGCRCGGGVTVNQINNNNTTVLNTILFFQEAKKEVGERLEGLYSFIYKYRYRSAALMGGLVYGYILLEVMRGNRYLGRIDLWASWKKEVQLTDLLSLSQDLLAQELLIEIQRRCTNRENPADFIGSLVTFLRQIEDEIKYVSYLMKMYGTLRKVRLALLFPFNKGLFFHISDQLNRLIYIRTTFLNWAANYKIEQNSIRLALEEYE